MKILMNTDSYKLSHFCQYPPKAGFINAYVGTRHVLPGWGREAVVVGVHDIVGKIRSFRGNDLVEEMESNADLIKSHGFSLNLEGLKWLSKQRRLPLEVEGVEDFERVDVGSPVLQLRNTEPEAYWLPPFLETQILRDLWYPSTVATLCYNIKNFLKSKMAITCDDLSGLEYKLHNFGSRGASSLESDIASGYAHCGFFRGTDSLSCLPKVKERLGYVPVSIPAMEHSTVITWGRDREFDAYSNMLEKFLKPYATIACVIDSYDAIAALRNYWCTGQIVRRIKDSGGTLVIRLDSGEPSTQIVEVLGILSQAYGGEINSRGFYVLPKCIRVLWGDGIDLQSIREIVRSMELSKYSLDNIVFGMGGALTQAISRDTLGFCFKVSATRENRDKDWVGCCKSPVTDKKKTSYSGVFASEQLKKLV